MDNKNVFVAIALSMSVLLFWGAFFETPRKAPESQNGQKIEKKTVTTGCGQGTIFGDIQNDFDSLVLSESAKLTQTTLISIINIIRTHESIYKKAGSVHGCARVVT